MVLVPKWPFFRLFFLGNIGQENVFYNILERAPFWTIKTRSSKSRKIDLFPKRLTHGIGPKMAFSPTFFLGQYRPGKCLLQYSRTSAFLDYKNNKFKKSKNWRFSKRVYPWFCLKHGHFSKFYFRQCRPGKCLLRYSKTKKRLSRL